MTFQIKVTPLSYRVSLKFAGEPYRICMHDTGTAKKWFPAFFPFNQCIECIITSKKGSAIFCWCETSHPTGPNSHKISCYEDLLRATFTYYMCICILCLQWQIGCMCTIEKRHIHWLFLCVQKCAYIYIHTCLYFFNNIHCYIHIYIYIYITLYHVSQIHGSWLLIYVVLSIPKNHVSRVGRPLHVSRLADKRCSGFFSIRAFTKEHGSSGILGAMG